MNLEVAREGHNGHLGRLQAESPATSLTVEVRMQVIDTVIILATMAVRSAHGILEHPGSIIDGMNEVMSKEQGDCTVDGRFVHRIQLILKTL